jgi:hypothetical protein
MHHAEIPSTTSPELVPMILSYYNGTKVTDKEYYVFHRAAESNPQLLHELGSWIASNDTTFNAISALMSGRLSCNERIALTGKPNPRLYTFRYPF